ncbi:hypothetical protein DM860_011091 [Cuscuta australis]|uniref:Uncharacterized protein n=1 Tax=Cuscuta australis TaxID=267555 RepID=A0A328E4S2_9ASTE|nr:hypothetical protein DM860_011091 [Cuscuta australis]
MAKEHDEEEEEGGGASVLVLLLDRKSSIETEPPTLHPRQLQFAREAALGVMKNAASGEEASRIFTQGLLQAVNRCVHDNDHDNNSSSDNELTNADADSLDYRRHDEHVVEIEQEEEEAIGVRGVHGGVSRPQPLSFTIPPPP